jgi:copper resistance protein D
VFGIFEWRVRTGRLPSRPWALVFPSLCVVGGTLLLAHAHTTADVRSAHLMEVTHLPLGVLAIGAGAMRWLELRLPAGEGRVPGRLWAPGLALMGVVLLFYREG